MKATKKFLRSQRRLSFVRYFFLALANYFQITGQKIVQTVRGKLVITISKQVHF